MPTAKYQIKGITVKVSPWKASSEIPLPTKLSIKPIMVGDFSISLLKDLENENSPPDSDRNFHCQWRGLQTIAHCKIFNIFSPINLMRFFWNSVHRNRWDTNGNFRNSWILHVLWTNFLSDPDQRLCKKCLNSVRNCTPNWTYWQPGVDNWFHFWTIWVKILYIKQPQKLI